MAYFSNSTDGFDFEQKNCARCVHGTSEEDPCPVIFAHMLYQGENHKQEVLDLLISREHKCAMFIERPGQAPWDP